MHERTKVVCFEKYVIRLSFVLILVLLLESLVGEEQQDQVESNVEQEMEDNEVIEMEEDDQLGSSEEDLEEEVDDEDEEEEEDEDDEDEEYDPEVVQMVQVASGLFGINSSDMASKLDAGDPVVINGLEALSNLATKLDEAQFEEVSGGRSFLYGDLVDIPMRMTLELILEQDVWVDILKVCLSDSTPTLRSSLYVKNIALHFISAMYEASNMLEHDQDLFTSEGVISIAKLLAYAYGDAFLDSSQGRQAVRQTVRQDEVAVQVMKWWRESPDQARLLRTRATMLLATRSPFELDYIVEPHMEKSMPIAFPRVLLQRLRAKLIPEYQKLFHPEQNKQAFVVDHSITPSSSSRRRAKAKRKSLGGNGGNGGGANNGGGSSTAAPLEPEPYIDNWNPTLILSEEMEKKEMENFKQSATKYWTGGQEMRAVIRLFSYISVKKKTIIRPILQDNGLKLFLSLFAYGKDDVLLALETVDMLSNLCAYRKFATEFINHDGPKLLFRLVASGGPLQFRLIGAPWTICFGHLFSLVPTKLCRSPFVRPLIKFALDLLQHEYDFIRQASMGLLRDALPCPMILQIFDSFDGVKRLMDGLANPIAPKTVGKLEATVKGVVSTLNLYLQLHISLAVHALRVELATTRHVQGTMRTGSGDVSPSSSSAAAFQRPRSDSLNSFASINSSSSSLYNRTRQLPLDKPVELDAAQHAQNMAFLRAHQSMLPLNSSNWMPIHSILLYRSNRQSTVVVGDDHSIITTTNAPENTSLVVTPQQQQSTTTSSSTTPGTGTGTANSGGTTPEGLIMLLQIVQFTTSMGIPRSNCIEASVCALEILQMVTLLPRTYLTLCEANVPIMYSPLSGEHVVTLPDMDLETVLGITVLLEAAVGSIEPRDAEMIIPALEVLCNCCSPSCGDDRAQRPVRRLARDNNALMTLLALLRYNETPRYADRIRYLACVALRGLANDHQVAQVLETLNITQALTKIIRTEPVLIENKRIHKKLKREAVKLIEQISGGNVGGSDEGKAILGDVADATNKRLLRNNIVERTQISFSSLELIHLIQDHLRENGFSKTANLLKEEAQFLEAKQKRFHQTHTFSWPTQYLTNAQVNPTFKFIKSKTSNTENNDSQQQLVNSSNNIATEESSQTQQQQQQQHQQQLQNEQDGDPLLLEQQQAPRRKFNLLTPLKRKVDENGSSSNNGPLFGSGMKRKKVEFDLSTIQNSNENHGLSSASGSSTANGSSLVKKSALFSNSSGHCTALERIMHDYLKEQHRKCLDPVSIIAPMSLVNGQQHQCGATNEKPRKTLTSNLVERMQSRECQGTTPRLRAQDVRLVHGHSKWVKTFRNITRNDDVADDQEEPINDAEYHDSYTSLTFLCHSSSTYEDLLLGTEEGDLVMRNVHTTRAYAKWKVHDERPIRTVQCTPDQIRVLTSSQDSGTAVLSKLPDSIVKEYDENEERQYLYTQNNRNQQEDELVTLWRETNISDIEMDRFGKKLVATLLNPEQEVPEVQVAAVVYDLATGRNLVKLFDNKLSSRYYWHRACFTPDGSNTVLHDGLLWDVRAKKVIHKFDKLSQCGRATFKPDGTQVVIDSAVWDMRTFKLFATCPTFRSAMVMFDESSSVAYSFQPEVAFLNDDHVPNCYSVTDVSDYTNITTKYIQPYAIQNMALDPSALKLAIITDRNNPDPNWDGKIRVCRLYEIGRMRQEMDSSYFKPHGKTGDADDDDEKEEGASEEDEDDDTSTSSGSNSSSSMGGDEDDDDVHGHDFEDGFSSNGEGGDSDDVVDDDDEEELDRIGRAVDVIFGIRGPL